MENLQQAWVVGVDSGSLHGKIDWWMTHTNLLMAWSIVGCHVAPALPIIRHFILTLFNIIPLRFTRISDINQRIWKRVFVSNRDTLSDFSFIFDALLYRQIDADVTLLFYFCDLLWVVCVFRHLQLRALV